MSQLRIISSYHDIVREIQTRIMALASDLGPITILEAGCGSRWSLQLTGASYKLIGVDLDQVAVQKRLTVRKDLDEAVIGDLRTVDLGGRQFDVIYCSFVLEHVSGAGQVLVQFKKWLAPNGVAVIRVPDRDSVKGFITRFSPYWFHVLYYKLVMRMRDAGRPGYPPYPTFYDPEISREGIAEFCSNNDMIVEAEYGTRNRETETGFLGLIISSVMKMLAALSFGRLRNDNSDLLFVIRHRPRVP